MFLATRLFLRFGALTCFRIVVMTELMGKLVLSGKMGEEKAAEAATAKI